MRPVQFHADFLVELLRRKSVAGMPEMLSALGAASRRTVVRKLQAIPHITSYSHSGGFYALPETARFDALGLWSFRGIRFSSRGTLLATAEHFVRESSSGFLVEELDALLGVATTDALRKLSRQARLRRVKLGNRFLYLAPEASRARQQSRTRHASAPGPQALAVPSPPEAAPEPSPVAAQPQPPPPAAETKLADARQLYLSTLDEQQRRLFAGLSSLEMGHGGDTRVAARLGLHPATVARGRRELLAGEVLRGRARRPGGGRKPLEKKSPH